MILGMVAVSLSMLQVSASPDAPATQPPPVKIDLLEMAARKRGCKTNKDDPGTVVVCGQRDADRYRMDPDTLKVLRRKDASDAQSDWRRSLADTKCSPVGQFGCFRGPAIDFFAVARVLARIAKGESITSIAKTSPNDYDAYLATQPKVDDGE